MKFWMNLYRQGWYHREGKPGTLPWHPGDVYPSEAAALADIDPGAPYLATVSFEANTYLHDLDPNPYPADHVPRPLRESRKEILGQPVPARRIVDPLPIQGSYAMRFELVQGEEGR